MKLAGHTQSVIACLLCLYMADVFSQTADEEDLTRIYGDKTSISIATGHQQPLRRAPAVATVITAEDIAAMGVVDLDEVLETVPGMHVSRSANVYGSLYVMRGIVSQFTPQTLVLQNGIPVTTLLVGNKGNLWAGYPVEHIARIEIIRGPGSAIYGADAYSGVINIITKTAADIPGTQTGLRYGSFGTDSAWVQHGGKMGAVDVAAYVRFGHTDGSKQIITADAQTRNDTIFHTHASLAPGPVNTGYDAVDGNLDLSYDKWRWRAGYKLRDNIESAAGVASALDPVGRGKSERITTDLTWNDPQFAPGWGISATASYLQYTQLFPVPLQLLGPGVTFPTGTFPNGMIGSPETWERQYRFSTALTYSGLTGHNLRLGLGHDDLNMYKTAEHRNFTYAANGTPIPLPGGAPVVDFSDTAPFITPHRRKENYIYVQDEWNFAKDWTLTAGVRHDRYSDFGNTTNPRAALVWDVLQDLTVKLLYGRAFRSPSFTEKYSITNPVAVGNPDLRPESIRTLETVFAWQARKDIQVNLNFFSYTMNDVIRSVPNTLPRLGTTFDNTGDQTGHGAELETTWDVNRNLRLSGNYAWQQATDQATHQDVGYAPHNHLYGRADWSCTANWLLSGQVNYVANRKRPFGDKRPDIPDYTTLDLTLRTDRGNKRWSFSASVRNLLNADVREPSLAPGLAIPNDLPMSPRSLYLQVTYQL